MKQVGELKREWIKERKEWIEGREKRGNHRHRKRHESVAIGMKTQPRRGLNSIQRQDTNVAYGKKTQKHRQWNVFSMAKQWHDWKHGLTFHPWLDFVG